MPVLAHAAFGLLLVAAAVGCSPARARTPPVRAARGPVRHVLANGIPVVVEEHRAADVVAVQLWVKAGARDERASELGLAHCLEHMVFRGTASRPPGFLDRDVERVGGRINAGTSLDYTYYHTVLPARRVTGAIEMLADVSVNARLDESVLEQEKRVVLEEMRRGEDNPRQVLRDRLFATAFDGHPYGRPVIGRRELIRDLERETLAAFYRRSYVPEAFALVVVGAVDPAEVIATATRAFGRLPRAGSGRFPPAAAPAPGARRVDVARPGTQSHLGLAWLAPRLDHADTPAVALLVSVLGDGQSSRLTQALRERLGLVSGVSASYAALEGAGLVMVTAQLDPGNLQRAEQEIVREIRRVRDEGVTEAEHRRAVTRAEAHHAFETETAEGRAFALGKAETVWRLPEELAYVDRVRAVPRGQIGAVARRHLDLDRYTRVAVAPSR
jgi:zinc protease